ncbi:MAG: type VI secretion system tip protein TssI/VgrG [Gemmatimonadales bacterium]
MAITQDKRLLTVKTDAGTDVLLLEQFTGSEAVSRPFEYHLALLAELESKNHEKVKCKDLLGTSVTVTIEGVGGVKRHFNGVVQRIAQGERDRQFVHYRMQVVPKIRTLQLTQQSRIFSNMTVNDVLNEVLSKHGIDYDLDLTGTYTVRDYCTQYRETDFAFISRLMEEEGIYYYFNHSAGGHTMVLSDNANGYAAATASAKVIFGPQKLTLKDPLIAHWQTRYQMLPGKWTVRDYDFQQPKNKLEGSAPAVSPAQLASATEMYDWHGYANMFNEPDKRTGNVQSEADAWAELRMQQEEVEAEVTEGSGNVLGLTPGHKFEVESRADQGVSGSYVITSVQHSAEQDPSYVVENKGGSYANSFTALKDSVVYRPPMVTPRPKVSGLQTAKVVDESDPGDQEEIWPDKYGRVRCRFPWDRDGNYTCWVRVAQQRAGKSWGFVWIPRVGDEVVISYVEGDPDQPLVVGSLYNADNPVPYLLPDNKTQHGIKTMSSPGGGSENYNEFFIEDKKGSELMRFHAEKDMHTTVENDEIRQVDNDRTTTIKNNETKTVTDGDEVHKVEKGKRTVTIHGDEVTTIETGKHSLEVQQGDHLITVKQGKQATKVDTGDQTNEVGMGNQKNEVKMGNIDTKAGMGNISTKADMGNISTEASMGNISTEAKLGNISIKADLGKITIEALQGIEIKCGPMSVIKMDPSGVQISGLMTKVEGTVQTQVKGLITQVTADVMLKAGGAITMIG